jgi:hypothetical protein
MSAGYALEHGSSRLGRWLRARRLRIAISIAVLEGLLVVVHAIPKWFAILVAAGVLIWYFAMGRGVKADTTRQIGWIAAASQAMLAMIPVIAFFVTTLALIALGALAVVALFVLFTERR